MKESLFLELQLRIWKIAPITILAGLLAGISAWASDNLESGFQNPPESAKPQTWWHWINGNVSKEVWKGSVLYIDRSHSFLGGFLWRRRLR